MADDSIEIVDQLKFQPCDTPRGCLYYNKSILTDEQQYKLNDLKNDVIRSDQKYLRRHPEIRALVALIIQYVFKKRPRKNIPLTIHEFLSRPINILRGEINNYIISHNLTYEEEEEEVEEESKKEYRVDDYYICKDVEEEEESARREEEFGVPYTTSSSFKSMVEQKFISNLILQQTGELPSEEEEAYEELGFKLYDDEATKTVTSVSTREFIQIGKSPTAPSMAELSKAQINISASPIDKTTLSSGDYSKTQMLDDVSRMTMSELSGRFQNVSNDSYDNISRSQLDMPSQNFTKMSNISGYDFSRTEVKSTSGNLEE